MFFILLFSLITLCQAGVIPQSHHHGDETGISYNIQQDHGLGHATSYQEVNIASYHPVPVYIKKEHSQLLEHPVLKGHTNTLVKVQHGGKHDHGYAQQEHQEIGEYQQQHEGETNFYNSDNAGESDLGHYDTNSDLSATHNQEQQEAGYEENSAGYEDVNVAQEHDYQGHY